MARREKLLPEDAEAGVLALADLRAERLPLAIGAPDPARIAAAIGGRPERDSIYAAIGLAAGDVGRAGDVGAGMMPRPAPGDRQSAVSGKSVSVRVDIGGRRLIK